VVPCSGSVESVPKWEELVYTRQFSYERQAKDLQDTELGRVRSAQKTNGLQNDFLHGKVRWEQKEFK
jgi:hypothetical protein